ncbi:MAG: Hsp70 family protein [bacterium]
MSDYVLGIDLGTSTTSVSVYKDGIPHKVPLPGEESYAMASVVSFGENGEVMTGTAAKENRKNAIETTISSIKRIIGKKFSDSDTQQHIKDFPYKVVSGDNDAVEVEVHGKRYSPQDISSYLLQTVKHAAVKHIREEISDAVITVPANFNDIQRRATRDAGKLAGLNVLRIVNEPTAAVLAYGLGENLHEKIAVFDFGGGTFDISILEVSDDFFTVLSSEGDSYLGGDDIDNALVQFFIADIEQEYGVEPDYDEKTMTMLTIEAERIKIELTESRSISVLIKNIVPSKEGYLDYERNISRELFNQIIHPIVERAFDICRKAIDGAYISMNEIDSVVLVGGTTKIPYIQQQVRRFFKRDPYRGIESEIVISMGASILGHSLQSEFRENKPVLLDVVPHSFGVGTVGDYLDILVEKNEALPIERKSVFTNANDNQTEVRVDVYQGNSSKKSESNKIGEIILTDLPLAKRGEIKIEVKFEVDTDGVLNVSAVDLKTGKSQKIQLNILGLE